MPRLTVSLTSARRAITILLAGAALAALAWLPSAAHASGCTNSWAAKGSGSWFVAGNWSKKAVPTSEEEVCITENGTASYTVEMAGTSAVTVKSLTIGGTEHTQTLVVASSNSVNADLTTSAGITNGAHGAITLTNAETSGNNVTIAGPISNAGTITSEPAHGGQRNLQGSITNTGTLAINANTNFNASKAALTNEGSIDVAAGVALIATAESSLTNTSTGKIVATGSGAVLMEPSTTFNEAGTTSGTKPVIVRDAALNYTGTGASLITQHGASGSTLSGNIAAGQSLVLESYNSENVATTASASFKNAGSITLTKAETSNNNATLTISSGTLTNSGTITTEQGNGGARILTGNITNTGTLAIDSNTSFNGSKTLLMNEGAIDIATGVALTVTAESSVTNASTGKIVATGTGAVLMEPSTTFNEAGTTSGTKPVIVRDAALNYTGTGASLITQHGASSTLSGNIAAGQSLVLESYNSENVTTTASAGFTNAGSITLTKIETSNNSATLVISAGTLTNSGTITTEQGNGGGRALTGNITNTGTLAIDSNTSFNGSKTLLTNEAALNIAAGVQLIATAESSVTNAAGKITAGEGADVLVEPSGTFTEGAGTSGGQSVILRDAALKYTGTGASTIVQRGASSTLSGNIAAGQSLVLESYNSENVTTTASTSFTNAGLITLTNIETSANNATLTISSGTLTNNGTITTEKAIGGARDLTGNITNGSKGTLAINANTSFNASGATLINEGAINIALGVVLSATNTPTISNEGGSITTTGTGALDETTGTFNEGLGKTTTAKSSEPVVLDRVALNYTNKGASKIAQRGASTLSGTVNKGQTLLIESSNSENAEDSAAASFTNSGTIDLTNAETAANNVTLRLPAGDALENKGKLEVLFPHGGGRTIDANLVNEKTLTLANGSGNPLQVNGTFSQGSKATMKLTIEGATKFGKLSASGAVALNGKLSLKQSKFTATAKESFAIITGASRTGEFSSVTGNAVKGGSLHYLPHYTATGVNLVVE